MRTCVPIGMGNAGSDYGYFQRCIASGIPGAAFAAAHFLERPLHLDDALSLVLVLSREPDDRYRRAAAKWVARLAGESDMSEEAAALTRAAFDVLPGQRGLGAQTLAGICEHHARPELARIVDLWAARRL